MAGAASEPRSEDARWMREALRLARRVRGRTAPNPPVGAVVVRRGARIAGGATAPVGGPHAEARALAAAGADARGATLYVTLEPCAHHGRTPPCVEAVLTSGVTRVVIGMRDPDPRTAGRSVRRLRRAGIEVVLGVEEEACGVQHEGFVSRVTRGRPFTTLKLAASLDGRIATRTGESRWISGAPARAFVHRLRAAVDTVAVGSATALADDPELRARRGARVVHTPRRVVIDSRLRTPPDAKLVQGAGEAWILARRNAPARRRMKLERAGARVIGVRSEGGHLDLRHAWQRLAKLGVNDVLVEGGGGLAAALLRKRLVDRVHWFVAPVLIGGDGRSVLDSLGVERLGEAIRPRDVRLRRLGADFLVTGEW